MNTTLMITKANDAIYILSPTTGVVEMYRKVDYQSSEEWTATVQRAIIRLLNALDNEILS